MWGVLTNTGFKDGKPHSMSRAKFINLAQKMKEHNDIKEKYADNKDIQNREIAFSKIFDEEMASNAKTNWTYTG